MHALKAPSFLRPSSRSSSPAPTLVSAPRPDSTMLVDSLPTMTRTPSKGPLNRLALTSRKRPPVPTPPPTPTLVQDGSYLEALSLKLSEAVSKALAQPTGPPVPGEVTCNGKRALPKGRGSTLGTLIGSELEASASNPHLNRAILRSLHRPLSVLITNISANLLSLLSSPQFAANPLPSTPTPTQLYAAAYASFSAELLESLDARGLFQAEGHGVNGAADNLRGIREGLESVIGRVINPLASGIKNDLLPLLETLEHNVPTPAPSASHPKQTPALYKGAPVHPSIATLQNLMPMHARNLAQYTSPPSTTSQTTLASVLISLVWRSLVALSHRAPALPSSSSPLLAAQTVARKKRVGGTTTPPNTPPSMRFSIKLPPSRPPSPPTSLVPCPATDAHALYSLFSLLPRPHENSCYALAREAVDEAFSGLAALCALLDFEAAGDMDDVEAVTADLPTVIALPVLLRIFVERGQDVDVSVPALLGVTEQEYRDACLSGFGRAEECGPLVAKRTLDALVERSDAKSRRLMHWLEGRVSLAD